MSLYEDLLIGIILGVTQNSRVSYLPVALVDYSNRDSMSRITCTVHQGKDLDHYLDAIRTNIVSQRTVFNKDVRVMDENSSKLRSLYVLHYQNSRI